MTLDDWDAVPIAYAEFADHRVVGVNPAWVTLLGASETVEGTQLYELVHPDDVRVLAEADVAGDQAPVTLRLRRADGTYARVLWSAWSSGTRHHATAVDVGGVGPDENLAEAEQLLSFGTFEAELGTGELRCSPQLASMLVMVPPTVRHAEGMLLPDERDRLRTAVVDTLAAHQPRCVEFRWVVGTTLAPFEAWLFPWLKDGVTVGLRGVVRDLTQLRFDEQTRQRGKRLLDAVDAAVVGLDLEGRVTEFNAAATGLYGVRASDAIGRVLDELIPEIGRARTATGGIDSLRQRGFWEGEIELVQADGSRLPVLVRESHVPGPGGIPVARASVAVNLAAEARSEARLDAAQNVLSRVTEQMADGVFILDQEGCLTYMNAAAERLLGWHLDELRGRSMHAVTHYRHGDGQPFAPQDCAITVSRRERREIAVIEDAFIRRDGTAMPVAFTCSPFITDTGDPSSVVVFSDTTGVADRESRLREHGRSLSLAARVRVAMAEDRLQIWGAPIHDMAGALVATRLTVRMPEPELSDTEFWAAVTSNGLVGDVEALVADAGGRLAAAGTQVAVSAGASSSIGARPQATPLVLGVGGAVPEADSRVDVLEVGAALISDPARHSEASAFVARAEALGFRTLVTGVDDSQTLAVADELGVDLIQGRLIGAPAPIRVPRWPLPPVGPGGR